VQSTLPTKPASPKQAPPPSANTATTNAQGIAPGGPSFHVNSFNIEGNTVIPTNELQAQIAGYVGKDMTLAQLYDVADVLTRYYRSRGYGLAYVTPPAQKLSAGNVRLEVVEGRVGNIDIQGNSRTRTPVLRRRTKGLNTGDLYTSPAAERAVLLMNDLPGVQAREVLSAGQNPGTSDVLFNVDEHAFDGDVSIDDYGRASIGRWRINADASVNSLTGSGDQLSAGITHSESNLLNFGKLGYMLPVGSASELSVNFNRAFYHVGGPIFGPAGIEGSTQNAGLAWQYSQIRTQAQTLNWTFGINHDTAKSLAGAGSPNALSQVPTNITLLQLGMLYTRTYQDASYYSLTGNLWTNGQSNSGQPGDNNSKEKFRVELDGSYVKPFADRWDFIGQGAFAYSPDPLVDGDKYSLGGPGNVRGFQSAEARGDRGVFGTLELQRSFFTSPSFPLAWGVFLDSGKVWTIQVDSTSAGKTTVIVPDSSTSLTSVGTEFQLLPNAGGWSARLQFAWAIGGERPSDDVSRSELASKTAVEHDHGPHIWLSIGKSF
jgi:hemolysin activation/secretion protein